MPDAVNDALDLVAGRAGRPVTSRYVNDFSILIISNLAWTLWFAVHQRLVRDRALPQRLVRDRALPQRLVRDRALPGFDHSAEAADKFAQAVRDIEDPSFGHLIDGRIPPTN
ncbi:hypothetical protein N5079_16990 [Planotetraspora sp. A-T 1434]|uniref:hypothetical protein n=1 Tax=Planotetraspora sp. A-T 1434 TaxID=2979219 RepID=UPI0021BF3417|nr:hypothetical protein [Planotetraspora sp. A-T 1434]MCT9931905.1 hypothetical protein [Planotetraspora sp. A-T 1434]